VSLNAMKYEVHNDWTTAWVYSLQDDVKVTWCRQYRVSMLGLVGTGKSWMKLFRAHRVIVGSSVHFAPTRHCLELP